MRYASDQELDVGLAMVHQEIADLRLMIMRSWTTSAAQRLQQRLDLATEELDMIEREQLRREGLREYAMC